MSETDVHVQPSYTMVAADRQWSQIIFGAQDRALVTARLAARTSYDGRRAVGDFLEDCHKLPAMVGVQLRLISEQSLTNDMSL